MDLTKWQDSDEESDKSITFQDIYSVDLTKRQPSQQHEIEDGFQDNSDTEGFSNYGAFGGGNENRLKSSNASVWSVEDEEDWGDLVLPTQAPLVFAQPLLKNINITRVDEGEDVDWNGGAGITSLGDAESDFEDGLNFDDEDADDNEKRTGLNCKSLGLFNGLNVGDDASTARDADLGESIALKILPALTNTLSNQSSSSDILKQQVKESNEKTAKQKPRLITLEMMRGLSLDDFKSKLESNPSTALLAPAASRTRSNSRLSQISNTDYSNRDTKKKPSASSATTVISNTKLKGSKPPPPRNLSRQSSAEEIDRRRAWVSHSKVPALKPSASLLRSKVDIDDTRKTRKQPSIAPSPGITAAQPPSTLKTRDIRKPPLKVWETPAPPFSTKVFVKRTPAPPPPLPKTKEHISSASTTTRAPPERWSSGSSRDMKRPPTHRVAFGRTLKDVPVQPQIKPKARRQPTLIKNLGSADTPKVVGSMVYDPVAKKWTGNEQSLSVFEKRAATIKPTLISNTPLKKVEDVGGMVFDPVKCVWLGNEADDDAHVFDEIDAFEPADTAKSGTIPHFLHFNKGYTGVAVEKGLYCDKALRDEWTRSENIHKLLIGSWYPRACDSRFIRDTSKAHLWEIKSVLT